MGIITASIKAATLAKIKKMVSRGMKDKAIEIALGLPNGTIRALRMARKLL